VLLAQLARLARACAHVATASRSWFTLAFGLVSLSPHRRWMVRIRLASAFSLGFSPALIAALRCCGSR